MSSYRDLKVVSETVGSGEELFRQRQEQSKGPEVVLLACSRSSTGNGESGRATGRS